MAVKLELFYSPTCQVCPRTREVVMSLDEDDELQIEEVNVLSPEGLRKAEDYGIRSVPTIVLNGKTKLTGIPSKSNLIKMIQRESSRKEES
jgi:small redox-active disulfide protein 1